MKTQTSRLTLILPLLAVVLLFTYCAKEELYPMTDTSEMVSQNVTEASPPPAPALSASENDLLHEPTTDFEPSLSKVLENTDFEEHPDWGVAIRAYNCNAKAKTLLVYNPNSTNIDFYTSDRFAILWFKNGKPVRNADNRLSCVCKGKYAVIVLNKRTKQGIGIAFSNGGHCYETADSKKQEH